MKACLTISVNYGDILRYTLPRMLANFDRVIVVTDIADEETREVVATHGTELLVTDAFYAAGAPFNKGLATQQGIAKLQLGKQDWLALVDSDIFLPKDIRGYLRHKARCTMHGCVRRMCETPEAWEGLQRTGNRGRYSRAKNDRKLGFVLGYFQFFSLHGFRRFFPKGYPAAPRYNTASKVDMDFARAWSAQEWLPFDCIHLGPEQVNWAGRKSRRFHA